MNKDPILPEFLPPSSLVHEFVWEPGQWAYGPRGRNVQITKADIAYRESILREWECGDWNTAITLTFRYGQRRREPDVCEKALEAWVARVRRLFPDARFQGAIEVGKDGTLHVHLISNTPPEYHAEMRRLWTRGLEKLIEPLGITGDPPRRWYRYCLKNTVDTASGREAARFVAM